MVYRFTTLLICILTLGCGDAEVAAQKELDTVRQDWAQAHDTLDPIDRVKRYENIVGDTQQIGKDFAETRIGRAIAAGQDTDGVSINTMHRELARLKERAECYDAPTVACLLPFASSGMQSAGTGAAGGAMQRATAIVCDEGFAAADAELEALKINRPAYADSLVQVAIHAAGCAREQDVNSAIEAYIAAEPSQGGPRVDKLMGLLQTSQLQPAWAHLVAVVEQTAATAGLPPANMAGVDLTLAVKYAELGKAETALAKYNGVAQNFNVDIKTQIDMASALLAAGDVDAARSVVGGQANDDRSKNLMIGVIHGSARAAAERLNLLRMGGAISINVPSDGDLGKLLEPIDATEASQIGDAAAKIEATLDDFVSTEAGRGMWAGTSGADSTYGLLGLIHQKLGDGDRATALTEKGEQTREMLARPGTYRPDSQNYLAAYQVLVALANGRTDEAIQLYPRIEFAPNMQYAVMNGLAQQGNAEGAMTFATQINSAGANTWQFLMDRLALYGHVDQAEAVLNAIQSDPDTTAALAWTLVEKAAQAGKIDRAEEIAQKYNLLSAPVRRLRMAELKAETAIADGKKGQAETALRDMFAVGDEIDKMGADYGTREVFAQNAAAQAFKAGYTDLGIELYRAASRKDQRPLLGAFGAATSESDFPKLLMIAHDNLQGEQLGYVVDGAIRRLRSKGGS